MSQNLEKLINLIRKTGDKVIVVDSQGEPSFVLMTIADYERLTLGKSEVVGLTEHELLDKINRDINIWKEGQNPDEITIDNHDFSREIAALNGLSPDFYNEENFAEFKEKIPENVEEDRYYFEPVEQ